MSAIEAYLERNARFAEGFSKESLTARPARSVAIVACMDARIEMATVVGVEHGDAHVIRNAGGIVNDDVIRSLLISQRLLGTREIMLIQHTECGLAGVVDGELADRIEREAGVRPKFPMGGFADLEENVRHSLTRLKESPFLLHTDAIRGFVFEVETGRLREVVQEGAAG